MKFELYYPIKPWRINQRFGENLNDFYKKIGLLGHNGIDFYALDGFPIYAAHDGTVTFCGEDGSGGLGVVVRTNETYDYYSSTTGELQPAYF